MYKKFMNSKLPNCPLICLYYSHQHHVIIRGAEMDVYKASLPESNENRKKFTVCTLDLSK